MPEPFVKICGLSTAESVDCALRGGADAIGFVFAESARKVTAERARELVARGTEGVETVGVFRRQPIDEVISTAKAAGVSTIQFHGHEPFSDVQRAQAEGFRTLRAFGIDELTSLDVEARDRWRGERLLVDAVEPGGGVPFDPELLERHIPEGWWLLAGGLTPDNVASLIETLKPSGVDVSSGVESSRGVKSLEKIEAFIAAAKTVVGAR